MLITSAPILGQSESKELLERNKLPIQSKSRESQLRTNPAECADAIHGAAERAASGKPNPASEQKGLRTQMRPQYLLCIGSKSSGFISNDSNPSPGYLQNIIYFQGELID